MKIIFIICTLALGFGTLSANSLPEATKKPILIDSVKTDPVCKMKVKQPAKHTSTYQKKEYWFCAKGCKLKFDKTPEKYLEK